MSTELYSQRLRQLKEVVLCLDKQNSFNEVSEQLSDDTTESNGMVHTFNLHVDLTQVLEQNATLGNKILSAPVESANLFQEVIFEYCEAKGLLPLGCTLSQICVRLRIKHFPSTSGSFVISSICNLSKYINYEGALKMIGIVTCMSGTAKYTQSTKYICPDEDCKGNTGNHYIRVHVPGASEARTVRSDFRCKFCGCILQEVKSQRTVADKSMVEIAPFTLQGLSHKEKLKDGLLQTVSVLVRDELVNKVELGKGYEIIGIIRTQTQDETVQFTMEANNITQLEKRTTTGIDSLPKDIGTMYQCLHEMPWAFPLHLAYRFGDLIVSGGTMIKMRLVLLISLVLDPQKNLLHVLSIGQETSLIQAVLSFAKQFALRTFPLTVATPLCGKVSADGCPWAPYFIQGGPLHMATGGVCLFSDASVMKRQMREQLQAILSGGKIFLDVSSKGQGGIPQLITFPLSCHLWGYYDQSSAPISKSSLAAKKDNILPMSRTGDLTKSFLDSFSYICLLDECDGVTEEEIILQMMCHVLETSSSSLERDIMAEVLDKEEIDLFLSMARALEPEVTVEAESLLYRYYLASRMARSSDLGGTDVPPSALPALTSLAIGLAKLKLSPIVKECDAVMAVYLYEESLTARFGMSVLNIRPQPHIPNSRIAQFLGNENTSMLEHFYKQLEMFCSRVSESRQLKKEE